MAQGIDCTIQITDALAKKIKAEGKSFVIRYFADPRYSWKCMKPEEAKVLALNDLPVATVYEDGADDMRAGYNRGREDAINYLVMAEACGQPEGCAAYFAADFDANNRDFDAIEQYLRGAQAVLPQFLVRPYSEFDVLEEMVRRRVCDGGWQTKAWSGGKVSKHAFIYQKENGETVAGISVDLDDSFGNEGWWHSTLVKDNTEEVMADIEKSVSDEMAYLRWLVRNGTDGQKNWAVKSMKTFATQMRAQGLIK